MLKKLASALSAALLIAAPAMAQYVNYPIAPINTPITTPQDAANSALSKVNAYLQANPVSGLPTNNPTFTGALTGPATAAFNSSSGVVSAQGPGNNNYYGFGANGYPNFTTANYNIQLGFLAGGAITTAYQNVLIGYKAGNFLSNCASGLNNGYVVAIGYLADQLDNACENTAIGANTLSSNTSGAFNVALGNDALSGVTTGGSNTGFGHGSCSGEAGGSALATGSSNTCLGNRSGGYISGTANSNVYVGAVAGEGSNSTPNTAASDVGIGWSALANEGAGNKNTAIGFGAMLGNGSVPTTGYQNVGVGWESLFNLQGTAYRNTALGANAGASITTGFDNTIIGWSVGAATLSTGSGNVLIGSGNLTIDTPANGTTGEVNIEKTYVNYALAPTITSAQALGTTPIITASSAHVFKAVVGASPTGTTETLTFSAAPNGWMCVANDVTTTANTAKITASSATSVTMTWSATLTANDTILHMCDAY